MHLRCLLEIIRQAPDMPRQRTGAIRYRVNLDITGERRRMRQQHCRRLPLRKIDEGQTGLHYQCAY